MRLGQILGGKAWAEVKGHAQKAERAAKKKRKDDAARIKRRAELRAAGFTPLGGGSK